MYHDEHKTVFKHTLRITIVFFTVSFLYALLRYVVFKGVEVHHIPLFISNKAFSLTAVFLVSGSFALSALARVYHFNRLYARYWGIFSLWFSTIHIGMSVLLFDPEYYPKFFVSNGRMNLTGELSMLFGVLAAAFLLLPAVASLTSVRQFVDVWLQRRMFQSIRIVLILTALHTFVMGREGWYNVSQYPGYMPPISLIGCLVVLTAFVVRNLKKR